METNRERFVQEKKMYSIYAVDAENIEGGIAKMALVKRAPAFSVRHALTEHTGHTFAFVDSRVGTDPDCDHKRGTAFFGGILYVVIES